MLEYSSAIDSPSAKRMRAKRITLFPGLSPSAMTSSEVASASVRASHRLDGTRPRETMSSEKEVIAKVVFSIRWAT